MTKSEWDEAYKEFDKVYAELALHEQDYKYGSNQKIRDHAERQMGYAKHTLSYLFKKYPEVNHMAMGGKNANSMDRAFAQDEFYLNQYIVGDLRNLLNSMKDKIRSLNN